MMWVDNGMVRMYKTLNKQEAYTKYTEIDNEEGKDTPIVLHFRIGTQGPNDIGNCHPFFVNPEVAFCHNGIIGQYSNGYGRAAVQPYKFVTGGFEYDSDTVLFGKDILMNLPRDFVKSRNTLTLIEEYITGDKMVFLDILDDKPAITIVNKERGVMDGEIWYSNSSFQRYIPSTTSYTRKKVYCTECQKELFSTKDKEREMCSSCVENTCDVCDTTKSKYSAIKISFGGKEHTFCPNCLDLTDPMFFGVFDEELKMVNIVAGEMITNIYSGKDYVVTKVDGNNVVIKHIERDTEIVCTIISLMKNFELKETVNDDNCGWT